MFLSFICYNKLKVVKGNGIKYSVVKCCDLIKLVMGAWDFCCTIFKVMFEAFCNKKILGLPWWRSGRESACQCRGHGFDP